MPTKVRRFSTRSLSLPAVLCVCIAIAAAFPAAAGPPTWIIVGDSWGAFLTPFQEQKLADLELPFPVVGLAVGGTTAQQWANDEGGLLTSARDALLALPAEDTAYVYVSLGGNDVLGEFATEGVAIFDRVREDLVFVVEQLLLAKPNITILLGSYDILNFDKSFICQLTASLIFGTNDPELINRASILGALDVEQLSEIDPRVLSLAVTGALQGAPRQPDASNWSPAELVTPDCIHLTGAGYTQFNDAMFERLAALLGP